MNPFVEAKKVEALALQRLEPWLQDVAYKGRFVRTSKGSLSEILQKLAGDILLNVSEDHVLGIELKAEQLDTGNMFIEEWSNRRHHTPGWCFKIRCDFLLYYFLSSDRLIASHWPSTFSWLTSSLPSGLRQLDVYPLQEQKRYRQMNDTWGRLVPVREVLRAVPAIPTTLRQLQLFGEHRREASDFISEASTHG